MRRSTSTPAPRPTRTTRITSPSTPSRRDARPGRQRLIRPTMTRLDAVIARGVDEGVIRADVDPDWVRQALVSPIIAAGLTLRARVTPAQVGTHVDLVLRGLTP